MMFFKIFNKNTSQVQDNKFNCRFQLLVINLILNFKLLSLLFNILVKFPVTFSKIKYYLSLHLKIFSTAMLNFVRD